MDGVIFEMLNYQLALMVKNTWGTDAATCLQQPATVTTEDTHTCAKIVQLIYF